MVHVDAKKLKKSLTLTEYEIIINALGIRWFSKSNAQWVLYNKDKHKDDAAQKPKLYFYPSSCNFVSYTKGCSYDIYALIQAVKTTMGEACDFTDALNFVLATTGKDPEACVRKTKKNVYNWEDDLGKYLRIKRGESGLVVYEDTILDELSQAIPQEWIDEGISEDSLIKYRIGEYERTNAITIPCQDKQGKLIGIRVRNRRPDLIAQAKYLPLTLLDGTTYKFPTNQVLYGLNYNWAEIERTGHVFLCEGEKSVLKLDTIYGEKSTGVAMYGSNLGLSRMRELLKLGVNHVEIIADNDWIGKTEEEYNQWCDKIQKQADMWRGYATVDLIWDNLGLLEPKDNALDRDLDTWNKLYESRDKIV